VTIVGGYSRSGWANIILIEELYGLKALEFCQNPTSSFFFIVHVLHQCDTPNMLDSAA
jgi:hypothetical protein